MGLPILIPYCSISGGGQLRWVPVYTDDIKRHGIVFVLAAVRAMGANGLVLQGDDGGPSGSAVLEDLYRAFSSALALGSGSAEESVRAGSGSNSTH